MFERVSRALRSVRHGARGTSRRALCSARKAAQSCWRAPRWATAPRRAGQRRAVFGQGSRGAWPPQSERARVCRDGATPCGFRAHRIVPDATRRRSEVRELRRFFRAYRSVPRRQPGTPRAIARRRVTPGGSLLPASLRALAAHLDAVMKREARDFLRPHGPASGLERVVHGSTGSTRRGSAAQRRSEEPSLSDETMLAAVPVNVASGTGVSSHTARALTAGVRPGPSGASTTTSAPRPARSASP
jgi:hypothetical protein